MATIRELTTNQVIVRKSSFGSGLFLIFTHKYKKFDMGYMAVK